MSHKFQIGDIIQVEDGMKKCLYDAKILSTPIIINNNNDDNNNNNNNNDNNTKDHQNDTKIKVKYSICGRVEFVPIDKIRVINVNSARPKRQATAPKRLNFETFSQKTQRYEESHKLLRSENVDLRRVPLPGGGSGGSGGKKDSKIMPKKISKALRQKKDSDELDDVDKDEFKNNDGNKEKGNVLMNGSMEISKQSNEKGCMNHKKSSKLQKELTQKKESNDSCFDEEENGNNNNNDEDDNNKIIPVTENLKRKRKQTDFFMGTPQQCSLHNDADDNDPTTDNNSDQNNNNSNNSDDDYTEHIQNEQSSNSKVSDHNDDSDDDNDSDMTVPYPEAYREESNYDRFVDTSNYRQGESNNLNISRSTRLRKQTDFFLGKPKTYNSDNNDDGSGSDMNKEINTNTDKNDESYIYLCNDEQSSSSDSSDFSVHATKRHKSSSYSNDGNGRSKRKRKQTDFFMGQPQSDNSNSDICSVDDDFKYVNNKEIHINDKLDAKRPRSDGSVDTSSSNNIPDFKNVSTNSNCDKNEGDGNLTCLKKLNSIISIKTSNDLIISKNEFDSSDDELDANRYQNKKKILISGSGSTFSTSLKNEMKQAKFDDFDRSNEYIALLGRSSNNRKYNNMESDTAETWI